MTEKELMEQEYRKKMEEHRQRMAMLREKRKRERTFHVVLFFLILLLVFLGFVGLRFALPYMEKRGLFSFHKQQAPSWEKEVEPLSGSELSEEAGKKGEKGKENSATAEEEAVKTADLLAKQYNYDEAIET